MSYGVKDYKQEVANTQNCKKLVGHCVKASKKTNSKK